MSEKHKDITFDELSADFIKFVEQNNYCKSTLVRFRKNIAEIKRRLDSKNIVMFDSEICLRIVCEVTHDRDYSELLLFEKQLIRCANALLEYSITGYIPFRSIRKPVSFSGQIRNTIAYYLDHRRHSGLSERTLESQRQYLQRFQAYLEAHGITELSILEAASILGYIKKLAFSTKASIHCTLSTLRCFFRYLHDEAILDTDWSYIVPKDNYRKETKLPSIYKSDEIEEIIKAVDRGNPKGKRDYAIILLAARLGLRASDICNLKFNNLLWEQNLISIYTGQNSKTY